MATGRVMMSISVCKCAIVGILYLYRVIESPLKQIVSCVRKRQEKREREMTAIHTITRSVRVVRLVLCVEAIVAHAVEGLVAAGLWGGVFGAV